MNKQKPPTHQFAQAVGFCVRHPNRLRPKIARTSNICSLNGLSPLIVAKYTTISRRYSRPCLLVNSMAAILVTHGYLALLQERKMR